ncbi:MAG: hypothetical protein A3F13_08220 [Gammaproteobacteria bacterium RIFCSPHIGHO2_12_FULL_40_19]|nr:MAG: hypothetical protein A3F13_08220 [Gammaproteobacteria bacterium RIFCSPHIGHO2_12_FULL_40_19]
MNRYPDNELSFSDLLKRSIRLHYLTLKHTIFFILVITLIKYLSVLALALTPMPAHKAVYIIAALIISYFFAAALVAAQRAFLDQSGSMLNALKTIWHRILPIYGTLLIYVIGTIILYYLIDSVTFAVDKLLHEPSSSSLHGGSLILMTALMFMYIAMFYFAFPITIIDEKPVHKAFYDSTLMTEKNKFGVLILFLILCSTIVLLIPGAIHEYFLTLYHLDAVFDFIVLCVAGPIYINLLLLLINDSKKQMQYIDL